MAKKKPKKSPQPTLFVIEGSIKHYDDGSMLQLHGLISMEEWEIIVEETVRYKVFLECLKNTGCPLLDESWDEEDDWFRLQLDVAVSRMRNIDPLLVAKHNQEELTKAFSSKMKKNAIEVQNLIKQTRAERKAAILAQLDKNTETISVSDL